MNDMLPPSCLLSSKALIHKPRAEDILSDEDLLEVFRLIQHILRKKPDGDKMARLLYCMSYALGDQMIICKPLHENRILFRDRDDCTHSVQLVHHISCCDTLDTISEQTSIVDELMTPNKESIQKWIDSSTTSINHSFHTRLPSVSYITNPSDISSHTITPPISITGLPHETTGTYSMKPDTYYRTLYSNSIHTPPFHPPAPLSMPSDLQQTVHTSSLHHSELHPNLSIPIHDYNPHILIKCQDNIQPLSPTNDMIVEPTQRLYNQNNRISREPFLVHYEEQKLLVEDDRDMKRRGSPADLSAVPAPPKKPKIPHRQGDFALRRNDIIHRMKTITMADLKEKAYILPHTFTLAINRSCIEHERALMMEIASKSLSRRDLGELLQPALRILSHHSNLKPHLDNGMNQNGIHYNSDYYRLYLAFEQFQRTFAILFPNEVALISNEITVSRNKDRERNANMKAYRPWIEPLLTDTNWATFRRNIVVGERMMQLCKTVGQGVLLMTKELSGSKLHLTFTNNEWDEFMYGLITGKWDEIMYQDRNETATEGESLLVTELKLKFNKPFWFSSDGGLLSHHDDYSVPYEQKCDNAEL